MNEDSKENFGFLLITYQAQHSLLSILFPVLISSCFIGWIYSYYNIIDFDLSFFIEGGEQVSFQIIDGIIFISIAVISSLILVLALKYGFDKFLKYLFSIGLFLSPISVLWLHGYVLDYYLGNETYLLQIILSALGLVIGFLVIVTFVLNKGSRFIRNSLVVFLGIVLGTIFGLLLSITTFLTLIVLLSLFDIYSVFKGPIDQMFKKAKIQPQHHYRPVEIKDIAIGIGDFIFYTALLVFIAKNFGLILSLGSLVGLLLGVVLTEKLLIKYGRFPGLPLPIFLSLLFLGLAHVILLVMPVFNF